MKKSFLFILFLSTALLMQKSVSADDLQGRWRCVGTENKGVTAGNVFDLEFSSGRCMFTFSGFNGKVEQCFYHADSERMMFYFNGTGETGETMEVVWEFSYEFFGNFIKTREVRVDDNTAKTMICIRSN